MVRQFFVNYYNFRNFVLSGAAIHFIQANSDAYIDNCLFRENFATLGGGAVAAIFQNARIAVSNCQFEYNNADSGGAFYMYESNVYGSISKSSFIGNRAADHGGKTTAIFY